MDVVEQHLVAGRRADMGNAVAHLSGPDDANPFNSHARDPW
jgi:hypothetical protein